VFDSASVPQKNSRLPLGGFDGIGFFICGGVMF